MKITILQRNIEWANPQANIARADEAISCLPDADLFVLPEMFSTGFCTQPEGIAESTLRFSVGIENIEDLIGELEKVFAEIEEEKNDGKKS